MSSTFAKMALEKMGWKEGNGLGKDGGGMKQAIRVFKKEDDRGVGAGLWEDGFGKCVDVFQSALSSFKVGGVDSTHHRSSGGKAGVEYNASPHERPDDEKFPTYRSDPFEEFSRGTSSQSYVDSIRLNSDVDGKGERSLFGRPDYEVFAACEFKVLRKYAPTGKLKRVASVDEKMSGGKRESVSDMFLKGKVALLESGVTTDEDEDDDANTDSSQRKAKRRKVVSGEKPERKRDENGNKKKESSKPQKTESKPSELDTSREEKSDKKKKEKKEKKEKKKDKKDKNKENREKKENKEKSRAQ